MTCHSLLKPVLNPVGSKGSPLEDRALFLTEC